MLTDQSVLAAKLPKNVRPKLFANRELPSGTVVAVRLNLNGEVSHEGRQYALQSVHMGVSWRGRVVGYDKAVSLSQAAFLVGAAEQAKIAAGGRKFPMAAVVGAIQHVEPDLTGVEVRFNPRTGTAFVRADDGRAVLSADEVTIFHTRVYARGAIRYASSGL